MEQHIVKIVSIDKVTYNVKRFRLEKPAGYNFMPGQATEVSINQPHLKEERRPFTFTGLNDWDFLEFTIKVYTDHDGVTNKLNKLKTGDELIIHDVWGTINYKGPGVFIAGGAGVTPFIAILRELDCRNQAAGNKLILANNTAADIILKEEFESMLQQNFVNILSQEETKHYAHGFLSEKFLKENISESDRLFYLCGPPPMMEAVEKHLDSLGIDKENIIKEEF